MLWLISFDDEILYFATVLTSIKVLIAATMFLHACLFKQVVVSVLACVIVLRGAFL